MCILVVLTRTLNPLPVNDPISRVGGTSTEAQVRLHTVSGVKYFFGATAGTKKAARKAAVAER